MIYPWPPITTAMERSTRPSFDPALEHGGSSTVQMDCVPRYVLVLAATFRSRLIGTPTARPMSQSGARAQVFGTYSGALWVLPRCNGDSAPTSLSLAITKATESRTWRSGVRQ